jgi:hypothetical protein
MNATICDRPAKCPHGTSLTHIGYLFTYKDGCRATPSGSPVRYWCGYGEMEKPQGVSITEGEYLAAWDLALEVNEDERRRQWYIQRDEALLHSLARGKNRSVRIDHAKAMVENDHRDALILNAGDELYDEAENENYHRTLEANDHAEYVQFVDRHPDYDSTPERNLDICGWCGGLAVLDPRTAACIACGPAAAEHAERLGEVPWSDRVDD